MRPDSSEAGLEGRKRNRVPTATRPPSRALMTMDPVDPNGHVGDKPLPVIDLAAMSDGHDHDHEHIVGNGVDDAVATHAYPIARTTSQRPGCWRPRVAGK